MEKYYIRHDEKGRVWEISLTPDNTGDWVEVESDLDMSLPILTENTCYRYRYTDGIVRESTYEELEQERRFMMPVENSTPAQKAATVMFRALAQTDVIKPADALDNAGMFPMWADCIGQRAEAGSYWRHVDKLYRVNAGQGHTIQADWAPDQAASLFSLAANPAEEWPDWIQPTGAHNAYKKGDKVTHGGKRWTSTVDANTWVPGAYGWVAQ